jgi:hypothetical protein
MSGAHRSAVVSPRTALSLVGLGSSMIIAGIKRPVSDRPGPKLGPTLSARHLLPRWSAPHLRPLLSRLPHPLLLHEQDSLGRCHSRAAASPPPSSLVVVALSRSVAVFPSGTGYCLTSSIAVRRLQEPHWIVAVYPRCRHR